MQWVFDGAIPVIDSFRGDYFTKIDGFVSCATEQELNILKDQGKSICGDLGQAPENLAFHLIQYYLFHSNPESVSSPEPYYVRTPEYKTRANYQA